eukprot:TRINITY_DN27316_c0_g1_i1.p1 TRINITY_DN27316_c0_g1~~TRINITY_DN27316_c0_g1_i1.p1  ORF type:complete len:665 (-),score=115.49 TRINITY_DN27316_c0_g1_i1:66-1988(-)
MTAEEKIKDGLDTMRAQSPTEWLLKELAALERVVQAEIEESLSFRKANARFDSKEETTQLLNAVCERLSTEKAAMDQASFAEHSSELSYLCQHFSTSLDRGLSEMACKQKLVSSRLSGRQGGDPPEERTRGRSFLGICCQVEFPPQQAWWLDILKRLVPRFLTLRAGKLVKITATEIVPGDIVYLSAGQKVAADSRVLVLLNGTTADVSHLTTRPSDSLRPCSTTATGLTPAESNNIVLKDSFLVTGALFGLVVRTPRTPFVPVGNNNIVFDERFEFPVDTAVPPGMTVSSCQSSFKALCMKAHLACRSFWSVSLLARSRSVVVLLTQELLDKGTVPKFVAAAKKFGKAFVLVNCDCTSTSLGLLAKQLELDVMDFSGDGDGFDGCDQASLEGCPTSAEDMDFVVLGWSATRQLGQGEKGRITTLVKELGSGGSPRRSGVIVSGMSQVGLLHLCNSFQESDRPLLYAVSDFFYPRCFRSLVLGTERREHSFDRYSSPPMPPRATVSDELTNVGCPTPQSNTKSVNSPRPHDTDSHRENKSRRPSLVHSSDNSEMSTEMPAMQSMRSVSSLRSIDPASALNMQQPTRRSILSEQESAPHSSTSELVVSLNSIGVVSENADCVLLQSDLACLGQAFEIVCKS